MLSEKSSAHNFPVTIRISADEMVPNGLILEDSAKVSRKLEELGVDAIHGVFR